MDMEIQKILHRLQKVNDTLSASSCNKELSFAEALCLSLFYRDFKDTNALVEEAESLAGKDAARLHGLALSLLSEAERYLSLDKTAMSDTDYETLFESHLKPFEERFNEAKAVAVRLWQEYSDKSNRLDYLPMDSDEYKSLDAECDKAKEEYDRAHATAGLLYKEWTRERDRYFCVWCFRPLFMDVLASRLKGIAESIANDLERMKEGKP